MSGELSGRLRNRVAIERRSPSRDAVGGADGTWVTIGHAWAGIMQEGGGATVVADARSSAARWLVTLRAGADVTVGDRLIWRGRRMRVRRRSEDPALPDRFTVDVEEER